MASRNREELQKQFEADGKTRYVRTEDVDAEILTGQYHHFVGTTVTVCVITMRNGFTVVGKSACANPDNFEEALGEKLAWESVALLNLAFDYWEPDEANMVGEKNFEQFREDIIILCGFYHRWVRLDGTTRVTAKSIAFANMSEDEFEKLYSKAIAVIIKHVLKSYTDEMLRSVVEQVEAFE